MDERAIAELVDSAYAAALAPGQVPALLDGLARAFGCHFADRFTRTEDHARHFGVAVGMERTEYETVLLGVWSRRNVWGQRRPVRVAGEIVTTREIVPKEELLRSEMYNDYLAPRGLHEGLRLALWAGDGAIEDISLLRPWSAGPFDGREIRLARHLLPHLQRSAAVARRLRLAEQQTLAGAGALDALTQAVFLLDRAGRVLRMNRAGAALVAEADGLAAVSAAMGAVTLVAASAADTALLTQAVQQAAGVGGPGVSGILRVARPSGRPDLVLIAQPTGAVLGVSDGTVGDWLLADPRMVLVIASDPAAGAPRAWQLRALFGLTAMEAAVALDLLAGLEVAEIARSRGRSVATVRTHVARLLQKTGTTRQVELLRLMLRIPALEHG